LLVAVSAFYTVLALAGAWMARARPGWAFLILFLGIRTIFFATFVDTPEPRYVLECFPVVLALGAQCFSKQHASAYESGAHLLSSTGSG
jgi:hypothetical protein